MLLQRRHRGAAIGQRIGQIVGNTVRKIQSIQLLVGFDVLDDDRSAAILQVYEIPTRICQHHFRFGGRRANDRVQRFADLK